MSVVCRKYGNAGKKSKANLLVEVGYLIFDLRSVDVDVDFEVAEGEGGTGWEETAFEDFWMVWLVGLVEVVSMAAYHGSGSLRSLSDIRRRGSRGG